MKYTSYTQILIVLLISLSACGPSQREQAVGKINFAEKVISQGDTMAGLTIIDSIKTLFPKAKFQIGVAKNMRDEIYRQLIDQKKMQLRKSDASITELEQNFIKEKTQYDLYTQYIPTQQIKKRKSSSTFLQVNLDERGELYLSSTYMGKTQLNHNRIKLYDGAFQIESVKISPDDPNNRKNDFLDYKWEKISFTEGKSDSLVQFICKHNELPLKCALFGQNSYYYFLEKTDIEAIKNAYELSNAIKQKKAAQNILTDLEKKQN
jgi:hypothetical protein